MANVSDYNEPGTFREEGMKKLQEYDLRMDKIKQDLASIIDIGIANKDTSLEIACKLFSAYKIRHYPTEYIYPFRNYDED